MACAVFRRAGRHAYTQVGVRRSSRDFRVAEIGVFSDEPADIGASIHDPEVIALVVEVWSESSDDKDWNSQWYADRGIPEYWLAEPVAGDKFGALITRYELARTASGQARYVEIDTVTLAKLERDGLGSTSG